MSVDFYECDCCEESRYEEYVGRCSKCGHSLCTNCLINNDIDSPYAHDYQVECDGTPEQREEYDFDEGDYEIGDVIDDSGIDSTYCPFCSGTEIHNDELLKFALSKLGIDKDTLIEDYKKNIKR